MKDQTAPKDARLLYRVLRPTTDISHVFASDYKSFFGRGSCANWPHICLQNMRSAAGCLQTAKLGDWLHLISAFFKVRPHVTSGDPQSGLGVGCKLAPAAKSSVG